MGAYRAALIIISAGVLTFAIVFTLLQFSRTEAAPAAPQAARDLASVPLQTAADSLMPQLPGDQVAVGVPIAGSEPLLRDVQPGDRLDVLASLAAGLNDRPVTAVVVSGATVLRPANSGDPLLLAVPGSDALVLAHLVLGGTHLGYLLWPVHANSVPEPHALAEPTVRALLDLPPPADARR